MTTATATARVAPVSSRTARIDWGRASADLDSHGWAIVGGILTSDECRSIAGLYDDDRLFRKIGRAHV